MNIEQIAILNASLRAKWENENAFIKKGVAYLQSGKMEQGKFYTIVNRGFENRPGQPTSALAKANVGTMEQKQSNMANSHFFDILQSSPEQFLEGSNLSKAFTQLGESALSASSQNLDERIISMLLGIAAKLKSGVTTYSKTVTTGLKAEHLIEIDAQAGDRASYLDQAMYVMNSRTYYLILKDKMVNEKFLKTRNIHVSDKIAIRDESSKKVHPVLLVAPRTIVIQGGSPEVKAFNDDNRPDFDKGFKYKTLAAIGVAGAHWKGEVSSATTDHLKDKGKWGFNELIEKKDLGVYFMEYKV